MSDDAPSRSHTRAAIGIFLVIGMATFVFGFLRLQKTIASPSVRKTGGPAFKTEDDLEKERIAILKREDTDKDGLNDYEEIEVFRTSPFLEDSDSDGDNDGVEIAANSDPNCPKGKTCRQQRTVQQQPAPTQTLSGGFGGGATTGGAGSPVGSTTTQPAQPSPEVIAAAIAETFGNPETLTPEAITAKLKTMSSAELRGFLVKVGIPAEALQKADDETLRTLLEETLTEIAKTLPPSGASSP